MTLWILSAIVWLGINIAHDRARANGYTRAFSLLDVAIGVWLAAIILTLVG